jgi:hypothetical protein
MLGVRDLQLPFFGRTSAGVSQGWSDLSKNASFHCVFRRGRVKSETRDDVAQYDRSEKGT